MDQVLVIDDEKVICELLSDALGEAQYGVTTTQSAQEGIALARQGNYDVIILDLKMPQMSGTQVLEEIKKSDPDAVVIIVTGFPTFESAQVALELGAYSYITKPFNIGEICFIVKRAAAFRQLVKANQALMVSLESQNIELDRKVQERTKELTLLYEIAQEISASLNMEETLNTITSKVAEVLALETCSVLLFDKETQLLKIASSKGLSKEIIEETRLEKGDRISGWVLENKEPLFVPNIENDERFKTRNSEQYYTHSFISVPLMHKDEAIGVLNVNNKRNREPLTEDDFRLIKGIAREAAIAIENARLYSDLKKTYMNTVVALTSAIDAKDHYTNWHSQQVTDFAVAIAEEMRLPAHEIEIIRQACLLHDIGKIAVHDYILTKPDTLTREEWEEMKLHVTQSVVILKPLEFLHDVIKLVEQHHEWYNGEGYPHKLRGKQIFLGARIITVADSFSAMVSERPYRAALAKEEAMGELEKNKGTQFDPEIVDVFLKILQSGQIDIKLDK